MEEKKLSVYCFMDLEKEYDRVNREALWQVLRMYAVGGKLLVDLRICRLTIQAVSE